MNYEKISSGLDAGKMPVHLAIILDGNGRWAKERRLSRAEGHRAGSENLNRMIDYLLYLKIKNVSLYAFSTENWKRPTTEISALWELMNEYFQKRIDYCIEQGIRIVSSGDLKKLPARSRKLIENAREKTAGNTKLTANFCLNYGSQDEILHACHQIVKERADKKKTSPVKRGEFEKHLYTYPLPPVDLLIRPGGETRLSNFLLWQAAYAELYFSDKYWPEFIERDLARAVKWFQSRERRFGGI